MAKPAPVFSPGKFHGERSLHSEGRMKRIVKPVNYKKVKEVQQGQGENPEGF